MSPRQDKSYEIISKCSSWNDLQNQLSTLDSKEKGDIFEDLVAGYLKSESSYATVVSDVWSASNAPQEIAEQLNLPQTER
jgi:predicted helicase